MDAFFKPYLSAFAALGLAAGIGLSGDGSSPANFAIAGVLSAAGLGGLFWNAREGRRTAERLERERRRVTGILAAAPHPWCAWDAGGHATLSPDCRSLLGIDSAEALFALLCDPAAVRDALGRLRRDGVPFRLAAALHDGRSLALVGRRGGEGGDCHDVMWIEDVTAESKALAEAKAACHGAEAILADLRAAMDALPVPVWLRGEGLAVSWCNRAYARAVDAEPDIAVAEGRELSPAGAGRTLAGRASAAGFAQSERLPVVIGTERRLLEVTEAPLPAPGGDGTLLVGYALDVTGVEELQAELKRHLAAHAEVLERLGTSIAIFGPDTRLKFFNQAYARLWDLDEAWLRSEPTNAELLEELRARRRLPEYADYQTFKREWLIRYTNLLEPTEELLHLPDGTTLRHLAAPHPLGGLISIMEDVTNTLALESSYNTLIAVQQETLDNLAEGIAVFGGDGRLKLSNPSFARVWDLNEGDLHGEPHIAEVIERMRPLLETGGDWEALKEEMIGATLERTVRSGRVERTDGTVVEFSTLPLPDGAVLNSYLDVTDSTRLELALRASNAALEAADQLKGDFIANVSHHLRTPLNGIIGFADVLANEYFGALNPRQAEYVKGIQSAGGRLLELIDDVVDLTSLGAGVAMLERAPVDVPDLLVSVAGLTREWARREGLKLEVVAPAALGTLTGDGKRLKQALFTLVVRAIRNPSRAGRIVLRGERTAESLVLVVEGAEPDRPGNHDSAALGLSLARNVIDLHGGHLDAEDGRVRCVLPVG